MSAWHAAAPLSAAESFAVLAVGMTVLVLAACVAEHWLTRGHWRRALWRGTLVAAAAWIVAEATGGNAMVARWMNVVASRYPSASGMQRSPAALRHEQSHVPRSVPVADELPTVTFRLDELPLRSTTLVEPPESSPARASESVDERAGTLQASYDLQLEGLGTLADLPVPETSTLRGDGGGQGGVSARSTRVVLIGFFGGSLALAVWLLARHVVVAWFAWRHTAPAADALVERVRDVASRVGSQRTTGLRVVESGRLAAPIVFGAWRPRLAVPTAFADLLSPEQLDAVLAHELVHVEGRDSLWQLAHDGLATLLWWNPLVWIARLRHRAACEAAADAGAAALDGGSRALAAALVRLARRATTGPRIGWAALDAGGQRRSRLGRRVLRLLREDAASSRPACRRGRMLTAATLGVLIFLLVFGTAIARCSVLNPKDPEGETPMTIWQTSWRGSLAAAAIGAMLGTATVNAADEPQTSAKEIAVELDLVTEEAGTAVESVLELLVELEPQVELLFVSDEDEEAEENAEAEEEDAEEEDEEAEDDSDEDEDDESEEEEEVEEESLDDRAESKEESVLRELALRAKQEAAAQLQQKQAMIAEEMARAHKELAHAKEQLARERDQMQKHLQQILAEAKAQAAKNPEAIHEAMERVHQMLHPQPRDGKGPTVSFSNEPERHRHHLIQAAENLRAIGKHDMAEALMREAEAIGRQPREGEGPRRIEARLEGREPRIVRGEPRVEREIRRAEEALARGGAVEQLRAEMNDLRNQVNDMRTMLERVVDRLEDRDREGTE